MTSKEGTRLIPVGIGVTEGPVGSVGAGVAVSEGPAVGVTVPKPLRAEEAITKLIII